MRATRRDCRFLSRRYVIRLRGNDAAAWNTDGNNQRPLSFSPSAILVVVRGNDEPWCETVAIISDYCVTQGEPLKTPGPSGGVDRENSWRDLTAEFERARCLV